MERKERKRYRTPLVIKIEIKNINKQINIASGGDCAWCSTSPPAPE
jgi:hypothetical protein